MAFYLVVKSGADEGKSVRIESGDCLIGRSPSAAMPLQDDSIAWEHAMVRVDGGKATLQNLSALGTHLKGRPVVETVRLGNNDEIRLSDDCTVLFQQRLGREPRRDGTKRLSAILGALLLVVVVGGAIAYVVVQSSGSAPERKSHRYGDRHVRKAYHRIADRMELWTSRGDFPEEALVLYEEAWRLEQAVNYPAAAARWERLRMLLLTVPLPGPNPDGSTIAQCAETVDDTALWIFMGLESGDTDFKWNTDSAYADALTWFVRDRAKKSRRRVGR